MRLSEAQLNLIRTRPQKTTLYLSIFQPRTVFKARINDASISRGARTITYDGVTLGSIADIEKGMTLLVGSADGGSDIGKIRIKSVSATEFEVSENSNIKWADDLYLSVQRNWELWPVFPRIIQDPSDAENTLWYKDWDIPYSNQNSIYGTFPCAGPDHALFVGEQVYYSATGTFNPLGDTLSYEWSFEGGTPTGSVSETPGFVTYPTAGHYITRLMVSGSSGSNNTTYRKVSVYDRPGQGGNPPILLWETQGIDGSRDEGGYQATIRVHESVDVTENSAVVIFSEDWYGSTKQSLGGNSENNSKIFFVGYVARGSIKKNYKHSYIEFDVVSLTKIMKETLGFSVSVESKASPQYWYEAYDLDCRRAIYHYLKWHTTALSIADFQFLGDDYKIQYFDADRESLYDAVDNLMRNSLMGKFVSDRQGKMWAEVDALAYTNPTGSFSSVMEITKRDWLGEPTIEQEFSDKLSYYEAGGIAYSGVHTGTFSANLAAAPGATPSFRGELEEPDGLALLGQAQLNQLVGNVFANKNSRLPKISMDLTGNYKNLDIAPQETVQQTIQQADTVAGIPVNGLYIPNGMNWKYSQKDQVLIPSADFINLVSGEPGETVEMAAQSFDSGFSVPQLQIPPLPILTIPPAIAGIFTGTYSASVIQSAVASYQAPFYSLVWDNGTTFSNTGRGMTIYAATGLATNSNDASAYVTLTTPGLYLVCGTVNAYRAVAGTFWNVLFVNSQQYYNLIHDATSKGSETFSTILNLSAGVDLNMRYVTLTHTDYTLNSFAFTVVRISG